MKITCLGVSTPNWPALDDFIGKATKVPPIRFLDENRISPGSLYAFLISLELFFSEKSEKILKLSQLERSLDHVHLSLGIQGAYGDMDIFIDISGNKGYRIVRPDRGNDKTFLYITATLKEWKQLVIENCREHLVTEKREAFNAVFEQFQRLNLIELFHDYSPVAMDDGTFYLEPD